MPQYNFHSIFFAALAAFPKGFRFLSFFLKLWLTKDFFLRASACKLPSSTQGGISSKTMLLAYKSSQYIVDRT